jgi:uncharacterized SAM-binding protein YcdF (DUF218 family)
MLGKKYIFETTETKFKRYSRNILFVFLMIFFSYFLVCAAIVFDAQNSNKLADSALFNKPPELIVVFTGDKGRIQYAFDLARKYNQSHIFITGVHSKNTVSTFLNPTQESETIDPKLLEIDYLAKNTFENVINLYRYLKLNPGNQRILIISHDYHITRIKTIMRGLAFHWDVGTNYHFNYSSVPSDYTEFTNLKKVLWEVPKLLKAAMTVMFWEEET